MSFPHGTETAEAARAMARVYLVEDATEHVGSAVHIDAASGLAMTAYHNVRSAWELGQGFVWLDFPARGRARFRARIVDHIEEARTDDPTAMNEPADLAFLVVEGLHTAALPDVEFGPGRIDDRHEYRYLGFPGGSPAPLVDAGTPTIYGDCRGMFDARSTSGDSGGAAVHPSGVVAGVVIQSEAQDEHGFFVPSRCFVDRVVTQRRNMMTELYAIDEPARRAKLRTRIEDIMHRADENALPLEFDPPRAPGVDWVSNVDLLVLMEDVKAFPGEYTHLRAFMECPIFQAVTDRLDISTPLVRQFSDAISAIERAKDEADIRVAGAEQGAFALGDESKLDLSDESRRLGANLTVSPAKSVTDEPAVDDGSKTTSPFADELEEIAPNPLEMEQSRAGEDSLGVSEVAASRLTFAKRLLAAADRSAENMPNAEAAWRYDFIADEFRATRDFLEPMVAAGVAGDVSELYARAAVGLVEAQSLHIAYAGIASDPEDVRENWMVAQNAVETFGDETLERQFADLGWDNILTEIAVAGMTDLFGLEETETVEASAEDYGEAMAAAFTEKEQSWEMATGNPVTDTGRDRLISSIEQMEVADARAFTAKIEAALEDGLPLYSDDGELIGKVERIELDSDGVLQTAIVQVGGFLGIGESPVWLDVSDLRVVTTTSGDLQLSIVPSDEALENVQSVDDDR